MTASVVTDLTKTTDCVRTRRLELVDDAGYVQAALEATPNGPRLEMRTAPGAAARVELLAADGTPRLCLRADEDGGYVRAYGTDGHDCGSSEPMAGIDAWKRTASAFVRQVCMMGGERHVAPAAELTSRWTRSMGAGVAEADPGQHIGLGGYLVIHDGALDLIHETPSTGAGLAQRLEHRIAAAVADVIADEGCDLTPDEVFAAYCEASEGAQGAVQRMGS